MVEIKKILNKALHNANEIQAKVSQLQIDDLKLVTTFEVEVNKMSEFNRRNLQEQFAVIKETLGSDDSKAILYTINLKHQFDTSEIYKLFLEEKNREDSKYKLSKSNDTQKNIDFRALYVGSSKLKNIQKRTFNHLGLGSKGVYSLHMSQWLTNLSTPTNTVIFEFYTLKTKDQVTLEAVEQALWDLKKPMFGKRSGLL